MRRALVLALALLAAPSARATQYSLDVTDESGLMAFLAGTRNVAPWGISYVVSHDLATNGAQIHANGYKIKTYITGGIAENFQGYPNAKYVAYIQSVISSMVKPIGDATGADTLLVNELNVAPGEASLNTPASIAYNVAGLNLARKFIRSINPSVKFGLSLAGSYQGAQSCLLMLQAGLDIDVCQGESYLQSGEGATNPFPTSKRACSSTAPGSRSATTAGRRLTTGFRISAPERMAPTTSAFGIRTMTRATSVRRWTRR